MRILHDFARAEGRAPTLVMLLPGAMQQPEQLVQAGFIDAVRRRQLPVDLAFVDLGLQYIGDTTNGSGLAQLHQALSAQALDTYRQVWLAGISIGGFMAMAYAEAYPGTLAGLCLLAPYPGNRILTGAIRQAGGLAGWNAGCAAEDGECRVWQWLKSYDAGVMPHIYLGYGLQDRFAAGQELMATALPPASVDAMDGTHDWPVWQQLWNNFLERIAVSEALHS